MGEHLTIVLLVFVAVGLIYLIGATIVEIIRKRKQKRPPQDHYYAERKKEKDS